MLNCIILYWKTNRLQITLIRNDNNNAVKLECWQLTCKLSTSLSLFVTFVSIRRVGQRLWIVGTRCISTSTRARKHHTEILLTQPHIIAFSLVTGWRKNIGKVAIVIFKKCQYTLACNFDIRWPIISIWETLQCICNKMQISPPVTPHGELDETSILAHLCNYVKTWRHPQNRK